MAVTHKDIIAHFPLILYDIANSVYKMQFCTDKDNFIFYLKSSVMCRVISAVVWRELHNPTNCMFKKIIMDMNGMVLK